MAVPADAEQAVDGMLTVFQGMFESGSLHGVTTTDGTEVGVLMLLTASAAAQDLGIGSDEFNLEMYEGFTDGSEGEVQSMEGESLVTGAPVDGTKAFVWFHEGVVSIFDGDPDESADFMTAYLQAHA
jgi:hypothetical protein